MRNPLKPNNYDCSNEIIPDDRDAKAARSLQLKISAPLSSSSIMQFPDSTVLTPTPLQAQVSTPSAPDRPNPASSVPQDAALLLIPLGFVAIWAAVVCIISDSWKLNRKDMTRSKSIAQLPCKKCRFFTNNPYLKCAVNPHVAMTKAATECQDYLPRERKVTTPGRRK